MFKIAILACDNGYGHLKRCLLIAYYLSSQGISVDLYGDSSGFKIAKNIEFNPKKKPTLIPWNFSYDIKYFLSNGCKSFKVLDKLPQLSKYDLVLSDNIIEVLLKRKDTILISQFFWHEVLKDIDEEYKNECRKIINSYKPLIFGDKYFSMKYIKDNLNFLPTGIFTSNYDCSTTDNIYDKKRSLLITGGNTNQSYKILKETIEIVEKNYFNFIDKIFIDENIIPQNHSLKIMKFDYTNAQFNEIIACICRPGIGIISDCIKHNIRIFAAHEENNLEMIHNSEIINNMRIGENLDIENLSSMKKYFNSKLSILKNKQICSSIDLNGVNHIYKFLKENIMRN